MFTHEIVAVIMHGKVLAHRIDSFQSRIQKIMQVAIFFSYIGSRASMA